uniref:DNA_MISMATCH_REPAIR_2 domain-containing protein n=2 Tax=Caenorhabditis tropicalis TaxID=1561998 RepID=A0A1I7TK88_9PELO
MQTQIDFKSGDCVGPFALSDDVKSLRITLTNFTGEPMDLKLEENDITRRIQSTPSPLLANCVILQTGKLFQILFTKDVISLEPLRAILVADMNYRLEQQRNRMEKKYECSKCHVAKFESLENLKNHEDLYCTLEKNTGEKPDNVILLPVAFHALMNQNTVQVMGPTHSVIPVAVGRNSTLLKHMNPISIRNTTQLEISPNLNVSHSNISISIPIIDLDEIRASTSTALDLSSSLRAASVQSLSPSCSPTSKSSSSEPFYPDRPFSCTCGVSFSSQTTFDAHRQLYCSHTTRESANRGSHRIDSSRKVPDKCGKCDFIPSSTSQLSMHIRSSHQASKTFTCLICGYRAFNHISIMSGGKDEGSDKALLKILKSKSPNTVAIFSRGEYFTVYSDDANFVATNIFKSDVCVKTFTLCTNDSQQMKFISVNRGQYEKVVRETIVLLRRSVELFVSEQGEWKMIKRGSPGNTVEFEQEIGVADQAPIIAVFLHPGENDNRVTLCAWDVGNVRIITSEFIDTPSFSQTEQCIFGLCPTEYILVDSVSSAGPRIKKLMNMFTKMEVHNKQLVKPPSEWDEVLQCVHDDFKNEAEKHSDDARKCLQVLHSHAADEYSNSEKYRIFNYGAHGNMQIDSCAVEALELFQLNYNYLEKSNNLTLYNVINKCKTLPGEKLLRDWLSRPLCEIEHINERLDVVEALFENSNIRQKLRDSFLARMPDCSQLARRLMRKCTLQDLNRFYQAATLLESVEMQLIQLSENESFAASINRLLRSDLTEILKKVDRFQVLCDEFFDFEYEKENKEIRVRVDFVPEIQEISEKLDQVEKLAEKLRKKYSSKFDCDSMKLDKNAQYGYYFRVTLKEEKSIRKQDVHILETTKGSGVKFTVGELSNINEEFLEYHLKYTQAEDEVIAMLCKKAEEFIPLIPGMSQIIATLDVFVSLATFAASSSGIYSRPNLLPLGSKRLDLRQCRHPVIEGNSEKPFIPNDVILDDNRLIILTGANMGGKSTYLRSAALSILLAQIGSFVPCTSATISVVDGIFTRVGASDKQSQGISTFMAEMLDCSAILQRATENSFVVIDELGRGTSTFDGFGIASAIAQDILNRIKCLSIFATHFHEMGELAKQSGAKALQMGVQIENNEIHMLYKVLDGVAQCSFGLQVARMVGIDENVINKASQILQSLEKKVVIDDEKKRELLHSSDIKQAILRLVN